jgi:hypothetical protein
MPAEKKKNPGPLSREAHKCIIIKWKAAVPRRPKVTSIVIKEAKKRVNANPRFD